jgi:hypothetical protein
MVDYLAMKCYMEKYNLHYFTFSPNSEMPIKAVIPHFPQTHQWKMGRVAVVRNW